MSASTLSESVAVDFSAPVICSANCLWIWAIWPMIPVLVDDASSLFAQKISAAYIILGITTAWSSLCMYLGETPVVGEDRH